jgi:hypothetical protein
MRIPFRADAAATSEIRRLGRTEDVQWSPSGRRLALVGFNASRVLILEVRTDMAADPPLVDISGSLDIRSPALSGSHGVAWIDERTVAVASRYSTVGIFELPEGRRGSERVVLNPARTIGGDRRDLLLIPGSISAFPIGLGLIELIVCNNGGHHVSRHLVDRRDAYAVCASDSLAGSAVRLPDGIAHSPSGRWIAVSSHDDHRVLVFRNDGTLHDASVPDGVLRGVHHPHGLAFTSDERWILAADADTPFVHAYRSPDGNWTGEYEPASSTQILTDASYQRGHFKPGEGGPKGIDLAPDNTLLAATCEEEPLVFYDLRPLLGTIVAEPDRTEAAAEAERTRLFLLRYLSGAQSRVDEATAAIRRTSEREIQLLRSNHWLRVIALLRRECRPLLTAALKARRRLKRTARAG